MFGLELEHSESLEDPRRTGFGHESASDSDSRSKAPDHTRAVKERWAHMSTSADVHRGGARARLRSRETSPSAPEGACSSSVTDLPRAARSADGGRRDGFTGGSRKQDAPEEAPSRAHARTSLRGSSSMSSMLTSATPACRPGFSTAEVRKPASCRPRIPSSRCASRGRPGFRYCRSPPPKGHHLRERSTSPVPRRRPRDPRCGRHLGIPLALTRRENGLAFRRSTSPAATSSSIIVRRLG